MLTFLQANFQEIAASISGLSSAGLMFYIWYTTNVTHARERAEWRQELKTTNEVLNKVVEQVNKLTFIIENYVIIQPKNTNRG